MIANEQHYLNSQEACNYLGLKDVNTIYEYIRQGKLKAYKLGSNDNSSKRHWRFTLADLDKFIKQGAS